MMEVENKKNVTKMKEIKLQLTEKEYSIFNYIFNLNPVKYEKLEITDFEKEQVEPTETSIVLMSLITYALNDKNDTILVYNKKYKKYYISKYRLNNSFVNDEDYEYDLSKFITEQRKNIKLDIAYYNGIEEERIYDLLVNYLNLLQPMEREYEFRFQKVTINNKINETDDEVFYSINKEVISNDDYHQFINKLLLKLSEEKRKQFLLHYLLRIPNDFSHQLINLKLNKSNTLMLTNTLDEIINEVTLKSKIKLFIHTIVQPLFDTQGSNSFHYLKKHFLRMIVEEYDNSDINIDALIQEIDNEEFVMLSIDRTSDIRCLLNVTEELSNLLYLLGFIDNGLYTMINNMIYENRTNWLERDIEEYKNYLKSVIIGLWNVKLSKDEYYHINKQVNRYNMRVQRLFLNLINNNQYFDSLSKEYKDIIAMLISKHLINISNSRAVASIINTHQNNMSMFAIYYLENYYMEDFIVNCNEKKKRIGFARALLDVDAIFSDYVILKNNLAYHQHTSIKPMKIAEPFKYITDVEKEMKRVVMRKALKDAK